MTSTFKALEVSEKFSLSIVEKDLADLPEGDLLIKVDFSSLNYKDAMSASGMPGVTRNYPHTPGIDAAGKVAESRVPDFKEGDEVIVTGYDLGMNTSGGFGEYIRVPSNWAVHLPKGLTAKQSMSLGTAGLTAGLSIHALDSFREYTGLKDTKSVVSGATGGVGSISVMLLSKLGSEVTAVTGKNDQSDFLHTIGASNILSREELAKTARKPIGKSLWDVGVDVASGEILSLLLTSLSPGGAVACSGLVGGPSFESSIFPFILRGNALIGIDSVEIPLKDKDHIWEHFAHDWVLEGLDKITKEVSLDNLEVEIKRILSGNQVGRVLVKI
ncbi:MAG TPA: acryloyl-CoA reductase [Gammaproteobacteria bacterium]|jgi:alcohol dehydrogenase|nr:acryloyl-CoA reductase [Gammaproteobacteria bacterium]HIG50063.1 acryloyl-CoA reductase [Gammaproteobacteria bacterium]HIN73583.1 acryloyl-CoA reductase [Gammaproteobacteria bacterium]HIO05244.1 acryloyl-CoA reductase [Gammaproteobacteria bacterium]HIO43703.1 acryloyl-CoA reductase [Gammaproteobacteria bacterium]|tara:strand:+ start:125 stop:1111 length:987 start_codon:yes stop_codon:yes gene_type:complete